MFMLRNASDTLRDSKLLSSQIAGRSHSTSFREKTSEEALNDPFRDVAVKVYIRHKVCLIVKLSPLS